MSKDVGIAWDHLEELRESLQYSIKSVRGRTSTPVENEQPKGIYDVKPNNDLALQVSALTAKVDKLLTLSSSPNPQPKEVCALCANPAHYVTECSDAHRFPEFVEEQVNAAQGQYRQFNNNQVPRPGNNPFPILTTRGGQIIPISLGRTKIGSPNNIMLQLLITLTRLPIDLRPRHRINPLLTNKHRKMLHLNPLKLHRQEILPWIKSCKLFKGWVTLNN